MTTKAARFRELHTNDPVLVLPNAWDVASAKVIEQAGAQAIATSSAGVAWSLGTPDGNHLDRDRAIDLVRRVAEVVGVPVTADIESGFGADATGVGDTVKRVIDAGAVGVNIEDAIGPGTLRDVGEQSARYAAARKAADESGVPLFVNARVDTFLLSVGDPEGRFAETVARARAYRDAGADGVFVPGVRDPEVLGALVEAIPAPVNVLAGPGAPTVAELGKLGVARVSVGGLIALAAYSLAARVTAELLADGTYETLRGDLNHGDLNRLLQG